MLQMLAVRTADPDSLPEPQRVHLLVEAMRRAYQDRARWLGDPDQVSIPLARLTSATYARQRAADIDTDRATDNAFLEVDEDGTGGQHTTHFSIIDAEGNRVAATLSINYAFGSGVVPPGTGVLLNNEMDDFSAAPGVPNLYGLVGSEANAIAPGKRMLSSMSPTFVEGPRGVAVIGTPGGSRIITMVLLGILDYLDGADAAQMVARPRFHHQYQPDRIQYEAAGLDAATRTALQAMGHQLQEVAAENYGNMQVVTWNRDHDRLDAASDPRGEGRAVVCGQTDCRVMQVTR
jgi:gamma-glutamyltranspeptidase/glutathione hydrolase